GGVAQVLLRAHRGYQHLAAAQAGERRVAGPVLDERAAGPARAQVHRVGQHEPGRRVETVEDLVDAPGGLLPDPLVDQVGRPAAVGEVDRVHAGAVLRGQGVQERLADRVPVLWEQRVAQAHHGRAGVVRVGRPGRGYLRGDHLAGDRVERVV